MTSPSNASTTIYGDLKKVVLEAINDDNKLAGKLFKYLESNTGVKRIYLLVGLIITLAVYLVIGYGVQFLSNLIGFVYPAYKSMTAIESPDSRDDTKWLTYWVVFGLFATVEYPIEFVLRYIPFYFLIKCLFFAWCFMPPFDGAAHIYTKIVKPFFLNVGENADNSWTKGTAKIVKETIGNVIKNE